MVKVPDPVEVTDDYGKYMAVRIMEIIVHMHSRLFIG